MHAAGILGIHLPELDQEKNKLGDESNFNSFLALSLCYDLYHSF